MNGQKPSIGRIVHYGLGRSVLNWEARAALVAEVNTDGTLTLSVFTAGKNDNDRVEPDEQAGREGNPAKSTRCVVVRYGIPYSETPQAHHWSWPPRVG